MFTDITNLKAISDPIRIGNVWVVDVAATPNADNKIVNVLHALHGMTATVTFRTKKEAQAFCAR